MTNALFDAGLDFVKLDGELKHVAALHDQITLQGWPDDEQRRWVALTALASGVEKAYSGLERILKNIIQTMDGDVPSSGDWHRVLVDRASSVGPTGRPVLLLPNVALKMHDLRSFRHRERHAYIVEIDATVVLAKAGVAQAVVAAVRERLEALGMPSAQ